MISAMTGNPPLGPVHMIPGQLIASGQLRACSHEPGTVNYPGVMVAPGQALPRVHMMICCPGTKLPRVNFIAPGQVQRYLITTNLSEFLYFLHKF